MAYRDLVVWQKAKKVAIEVYQLTNTQPLRGDRSLCDQMQRAAVSIASNIAEGDERGTEKESIRFFFISKASAAELLTQIEIAEAVYTMNPDNLIALKTSCEEISKMLHGLISSRKTER